MMCNDGDIPSISERKATLQRQHTQSVVGARWCNVNATKYTKARVVLDDGSSNTSVPWLGGSSKGDIGGRRPQTTQQQN